MIGLEDPNPAIFPVGQTHALPLFEGRQSRTHRRIDLNSLRVRADALAGRFDFANIETLVQFAGFPRSGHSIVGSVIDGHPDAIVSHELDVLGLVDVGFSREQICALIAENSAEFESSGRFWNGHCYHIPGAAGGRSSQPIVIGDKKGDWAIRRLGLDSTILGRCGDAFKGARNAWICILRNPFDNVATLSLRKGRHYDVLRIAAETDTDFKQRLKIESELITRSMLPEMLEDYAKLCEGVAALKAQIRQEDWLEVRHEAFVAAPRRETSRIFEFLGLGQDRGTLSGAEQITREVPNRSREDIEWQPSELASIDLLINQYHFLSGYTFEGM